MLRLGLTGGIGSGKSTVARRLVAHGAVLIDADVIAREVVAPGTDGLAALVEAFGPEILAPDGSLDRPALAAVVFADDAARSTLNGITHPRVRERAAELQAGAAADAVVVQDVPLLVEGGMAAAFALVVVVGADPEVRVRRLVEQRGMPEADARARISAQADEAARRAVADVWIDNGGTPAETAALVDRLWTDRLVPFEENIRLGRPAPGDDSTIVAADPGWPAVAERLAAKVRVAAGEHGRDVAHIGATAIPGMPAADVVDLQLGVASTAAADALRDALTGAGFPARTGARDGSGWLFGSADPARPATVRVRETGSPEWRNALLLRDWLRTDAGAAAEYLSAARRAGAHDDGAVEQPWLAAALRRAERWAATSGWAPSLH